VLKKRHGKPVKKEKVQQAAGKAAVAPATGEVDEVCIVYNVQTLGLLLFPGPAL